jgi:hypothetical protein
MRRAGSWWPFWRALLLAVALCIGSPRAGAQTVPSLPPSPDIAPASSPITPTDSFVSAILRPLLEQALSSSESSDQRLIELQRQSEIDRQQRIAELKLRQLEQADSAQAYRTLSDRAARLQSCYDGLSSRLTDISGSEEERQAAALAALDGIQADARALTRSRNTWRAVGIGGGVVAVLALIWAAVK